jgi:hypothetical protein
VPFYAARVDEERSMPVERSEDRDQERIPRGVGAMSVLRWGLVVVMGVVALLSIADATGALARVAPRGARAGSATLYYCPMHPSVVQDHAGECPICSMTLVPKPAALARAGPAAPTAVPGLAALDLPEDRVQLIGMRTAKVARAALADSLRAFGVLASADRSKVRFLADVFEQDVAGVRLGQKAVVELTAYPDERFTGRVQLISPTVDTARRALRVQVELANERGDVKLRVGMSGTVTLALPAASGLVIPSEALVDTGERRYVFVARAAGHFEPRQVQVGARVGDEVRVVRCLEEGETVVTTGNFLLDSESRLRAAIDGQK